MFQPAQIRAEKGAQIGHAIFQHSQPVNAHAESKTLIFFRVNAGMGQHMWVDHAAAANFHPVIARADHQLVAIAVAAHIHFHARLGEREITRTQPNGDIIDLEKRRQKRLQRVFQMAHMRGLIDHQPFDLMKHRRVRLVAVAAIGAPRRDKAKGRVAGLHGADLHGACMRAKQKRLAVFFRRQVKRVMHLSRGVGIGNIQRGEIIKPALNVGAFSHIKAHAGKNRRKFFHGLADRMNAAFKLRIGFDRQGHIERFRCQTPRHVFGLQRRATALDGFCHLHFKLIENWSEPLAVIVIHAAQRFKQRRYLALFAQCRNAHIFERRQVCRRCNRVHYSGFNRARFVLHAEGS